MARLFVFCQRLAFRFSTFAINRKVVTYGNGQEVLLAKDQGL